MNRTVHLHPFQKRIPFWMGTMFLSLEFVSRRRLRGHVVLLSYLRVAKCFSGDVLVSLTIPGGFSFFFIIFVLSP